jgi:hypothetical protein
LNCAIIDESDIHWGRSHVVDVAIRKVPVCSIVHIIPLILIYIVFYFTQLFRIYLY